MSRPIGSTNQKYKQFCKYGHDFQLFGKTKSGACKICFKEYGCKYNKEYNREYIKTKKGKVSRRKYARKYSQTDQYKQYKREYTRDRAKNDIFYQLKVRLRNRTRAALEAKLWHKNTHFNEYIGCTLEELKIHLENQFQPGMSWKNHSLDGWHVDHIVPLSSAKTTKKLYKLCHYTNLQPLWAKENLRKGTKI